ncbi:hypothetical protein CEXT_83111 [Caerostris extrusa]|uniref:Uncharacterized protein n=1 Tax=Caerostris extrusa TaxID=172846 RepID=A0AAV4SF06_CAEEX|nr:hypothetical protein CEXT_83111 [Caerostris extrusa]
MNGATINGSKIRVDPFRGDGVKRGDRGDGDIRSSKDGGYSSGDKRGDCGGGEYRGVRGDGFRYRGDRGSRYGKPSYGCGGVYRSRSTMGPSKKQRWLYIDQSFIKGEDFNGQGWAPFNFATADMITTCHFAEKQLVFACREAGRTLMGSEPLRPRVGEGSRSHFERDVTAPKRR